MKKTILSMLLAGFVLAPASAAFARDYWHWSDHDRRWEHRAAVRSDYRDLAEARRQLEYDRRHHASRRRIAADEARIRDLERDLRVDRRRFAARD